MNPYSPASYTGHIESLTLSPNLRVNNPEGNPEGNPEDSNGMSMRSNNFPWQNPTVTGQPVFRTINDRQVSSVPNPGDAGVNGNGIFGSCNSSHPVNASGSTGFGFDLESGNAIHGQTTAGNNGLGSFGSSSVSYDFVLPSGLYNPGFVYHGKTYRDDDPIYLIYYFHHSGSESVQLTSEAFAELLVADPEIFQDLASPRLLFSRCPGSEICMSDSERILRYQPLAHLINDEISKGKNNGCNDLSRIFEVNDLYPYDELLLQVVTKRNPKLAAMIESYYSSEAYQSFKNTCVSSWGVSKVPFGLFRRGFYSINQATSSSQWEFAGPEYKKFNKARGKWAQVRFVSQLQKLIHESNKADKDIVKILKNACPPESSLDGKKSLTFMEIAVELDNLLGDGMTGFESQLASPQNDPSQFIFDKKE